MILRRRPLVICASQIKTLAQKGLNTLIMLAECTEHNGTVVIKTPTDHCSLPLREQAELRAVGEPCLQSPFK